MPTSKGVTISILVDGKALEEHDVSFDGKSITSYIICPDDKEFRFRLDFSSTGAKRHIATLFIDEVWAATCGTKKHILDVIKVKQRPNGGQGGANGQQALVMRALKFEQRKGTSQTTISWVKIAETDI